jgi:hypothetical protein
MRTTLPLWATLASLACRAGDPLPPVDTFLDATDRPALRGTAPVALFDQSELFEPCALLEGATSSEGSYGTAAAYRGHLVLPWTHSAAWPPRGGALSLFDLTQPCEPQLIGAGLDPAIGTTRALGFVHLREDDAFAGDWAVTQHVGSGGEAGVRFWDLADPLNPTVVSALELPDTLAIGETTVAWQYPWLWLAAGSSGVVRVDATDPVNPSLSGSITFDAGFFATDVQALGGLLFVTSAGGQRAAFVDISDPLQPVPIAGGSFVITDGAGQPEPVLGASLLGQHAVFSRFRGQGGALIWDVSDPAAPSWVSEQSLLERGGGRVHHAADHLFLGSSTGIDVVRVRDLTDPDPEGSAELPGENNALIPFGNLAIAITAAPGLEDAGATVLPWTQQPDTSGPELLRVNPTDQAVGVAPTTAIGLAFNEPIEPSSVFAGSVRLYADDDTPIEGWGTAQGAIASYTPYEPLTPGTSYRVEVRADGVTDLHGNPIAATFTATFTTAD